MSLLRRILKETARVRDGIHILGGTPRPTRRGMFMPDGSPTSVEFIMETYRVDRTRAEEIVRRRQEKP